MKLPERLSPRVPAICFAVLALASVGAFYLTQHLKVANPFYNGSPRVDPAEINPRAGGICTDAAGQMVSFRTARIGFYLQSKSDVVYVNVFNADGQMVAQMRGSGRYIRAATGANPPYSYFTWNGRTSSGRDAPAGVYTLRLYLKHQDRNVPISGQSITVSYATPVPRVTGVTVDGSSTTATSTTATSTLSTTTSSTASTTTAATTASTTSGSTTATSGGTPTFTPGAQTVTIHYRGGGGLGANVHIYRASASGTLTLVQSYGINSHSPSAPWNGMINGRPAPAGSYLVGVSVLNNACTQGQFPLVDDPAPNSTVGAGVNVTYLDATPPLDPVPAGHLASVTVQSGGASYQWALRRAGQSHVIFHGSNPGGDPLGVRLPAIGLYELAIRANGERTSVPVVASGVGPRAGAGVLVVLPALSWQGQNATDGSSDGLIDTLSNGDTIHLDRPLVDGLPADVANEAALLNTLDSDHLSYDLTTDVALAEGVGPGLEGRSGVLLDGDFTWLPAQIYNPLRGFVRAGGGAFAAGLDSLGATASVSGSGDAAVAGPAQAVSTDPFEVHHGTVSPSYGQIIAEFTDGLGIFSTTAALQYPRYQVLQPPAGRVSTAAGVSEAAPAVIGFHLGKGTVVEAGLPHFGSSLSSDVDARELLSRIWQVVLR